MACRSKEKCMLGEDLVQAVTWCHSCHARNLPLFRL
jgi:hypothetical protein